MFETIRKRYSPFALFILALLYMSQGLPHGFVKVGLQAYLYDRGFTLTQIGFTGILMTPWAFKFVWAPFADRIYSERFGRRRSWIIPLQLGYLICMAAAVFLIGKSTIMPFLIAVFGMSLFASAQDVSVDGLAIDTLKPHALGLGNAMQVGAYRIGMIVAGSVLLPFVRTIGWDGYFCILLLIATLPLIPLLFFTEKPVAFDEPSETDVEKKPTFKEIFRATLRMIANPKLRWLLLFLLTYKIGEEMVQTLYVSFLKKNAFSNDLIGHISLWGMASATVASVIAGLLLTKIRVTTMIGIALFLRIIPIALQCYMAHGHVTHDLALIVSLTEHFPGSLLTTATFALMMSLVSKRVGATEYTILGLFEVIGKFVPSGSGIIVDAFNTKTRPQFGYEILFFTGLIISILVIIPWYKCRNVDIHGT